MEYKISCLSRFKKPLPCFLCNASVKNNENFCVKCKKTVITRSPSPAPRLSQKISAQESSKFFYLKSTSLQNQHKTNKPQKETAHFKDPFKVSQSIDRIYAEKILKKDISIENVNKNVLNKRPQSSFDINLLLNQGKNNQRHYRKKKKINDKRKFYRISKSPIPELRPSTQMSKYMEISDMNPQLTIQNSYDCHNNTLTDICYVNNNEKVL